MADHRLRHGFDGIRKHLERFVGVDSDLLVPRRKVLCDQVRISELVAGMFSDGFKADRKRPDVLMTKLAQQRYYQRTVQAARQQHADRHVRHSASVNGSQDRAGERVGPFLLRHSAVGRPFTDIEAPVSATRSCAVRPYRQDGCRFKFLYAPQHRTGRRHRRVEAEEVVQPDRVK